MKKHLRQKQLQKRFLGFGSVLLALVASADPGDSPAPKYTLVKPEAKSLNRFGVSYRMGFNISAKFTDLGGGAGLPSGQQGLLAPDGPQQGTANYDDGYLFVDAYGDHHNAPGDPNPNPALDHATTYWGVLNQSQIMGDGTIALTRTTTIAAGESRSEDDPQHGFELTYNRQLGDVGRGHWGVEGAFNYMQICLGNNHPPAGSVSSTTDIFTLPGGVQPISAPFSGSFYGSPPGQPQSPLLLDSPDSTTTVLTAGSLSGSRHLNADIYGFRFGPYLEAPLGGRVEFYLSAGLAMAYVDSDFRFQDDAVTGGGSRAEMLYGGYVAGNFSVALNEAWSLTAGAQYQDVGKFLQTVGSKQAELDLSQSIFVTLGVSYNF